ncbi:MAG: MaoC family dehydratase [Casimicrobiaceae bacterium]|nr:MaoC family dehydratase [Casimicrobiaceae bacterium]MCX8097512.1 MaoC family dehydratase [Casimicrobiaceae bacterium]MDW8313294.1 MaoC family dehydratase [Burkholderiales bacterium]
MRFADFYAGQVITLGPVALNEAQIVAFAQEYDPQWFHIDRERAAAGRWGGLIASGWQTCALAMRLVCDHLLVGSESFGSPGLAYVKWPAPVRPNEPLTLKVEVLEARRSASRPELGILRWRWQFEHGDGRIALDLEATSLFDLTSSG